ncbi:MAG: T9SS type A sorting domain-containing protein [Bacteroidetes bacterium]|nr:T9SS type A sorting domain-containing protein [Bacteroidota bacterium]
MGKNILNGLIMVIVALLTLSSTQAQTVSVSGKYIYPNANQTPLSNIQVALVDKNNQVISTTITNSEGIYLFPRVPYGDYTIKASTTQPSPGYTMSDCFKLLLYLSGYNTLTSIQKLAADVDNNNIVDRADFNLMLAKWLNPSIKFPAGDWKFEEVHFTINSGKGAAAPDVPIPPSNGTPTGDLGSVMVPGNKPATTIASTFTNFSSIINTSVELPVKLNTGTPVSTLGLTIECPSNFKIEQIVPSIQGLNVNIEGNLIRATWIDSNIKLLDAANNTTLFVIKGKALNNSEITFSLGDNSQLISKSGEVINAAKIELPRLSIQQNETFAFALKGNFPNPFNTSTKIVYSLPSAGNVEMKIFNIQGQLVATPIKGYQDAGIKELPFDGNNLQSGVYFCTISLKGDKNFNATSRMVVAR